jgi:hypothetical protein
VNTEFHEDVDTRIERPLDARRNWYCVRWPSGECLHLFSLSAESALEWTRAENGAPHMKGKVVNALTCQSNGHPMPLLRTAP